MPDPERLHDWWWCDQSKTFHQGSLESFSMEHRQRLHPAFVVIEDRGAVHTEGGE